VFVLVDAVNGYVTFVGWAVALTLIALAVYFGPILLYPAAVVVDRKFGPFPAPPSWWGPVVGTAGVGVAYLAFFR
jgi:hypothetical protein